MIRTLLILTVAATTACATVPTRGNDVFSRPELYNGKVVEACGYRVDRSNIIDSRTYSSSTRGLSIIEVGNLDIKQEGRICVEGDISYVGCGNEKSLCVDWAFDYGIRIRRVLTE